MLVEVLPGGEVLLNSGVLIGSGVIFDGRPFQAGEATLSPGGARAAGVCLRLRVVLSRLDPGFAQEELIFTGRCVEARF